jgi:hypothetical protein
VSLVIPPDPWLPVHASVALLLAPENHMYATFPEPIVGHRYHIALQAATLSAVVHLLEIVRVPLKVPPHNPLPTPS